MSKRGIGRVASGGWLRNNPFVVKLLQCNAAPFAAAGKVVAIVADLVPGATVKAEQA
jgi:hypothetical protein